MNARFGGSSNILFEFFGGLECIDKQSEFNNTFGSDPVTPPTNPAISDKTATTNLFLNFSDQCRLDVYLHTCHKFYVGNTSVDTSTSMMEVCRKISNLRLERMDKNGRQVVDTMEELFTNLLALAGSFPDCARG